MEKLEAIDQELFINSGGNRSSHKRHICINCWNQLLQLWKSVATYWPHQPIVTLVTHKTRLSKDKEKQSKIELCLKLADCDGQRTILDYTQCYVGIKHI